MCDGAGVGNGSPVLGGAAGGSPLDPGTGRRGPESPITHLLASPVTYPSIAEPDKASLTGTEPRSQPDTQAARKWRPGPDGNCRRCRSAQGSVRRKEPSAPAADCGRRAAGARTRGSGRLLHGGLCDARAWGPPPPMYLPGMAVWFLWYGPVQKPPWCSWGGMGGGWYTSPPSTPSGTTSGGWPLACRTAPLCPSNQVPTRLPLTYVDQGKMIF